MRALLLFLFAGTLAAAPSPPRPEKPASPSPPEIKEGYYRCRGELPGGKPYSCLAAVRKLGETYALEFYGASPVVAAGVRRGDVLSIGFGGGRGSGVAVYEVQAGGKLSGVTAQLPPLEGGSHGRETLTWFAAFERDE